MRPTMMKRARTRLSPVTRSKQSGSMKASPLSDFTPGDKMRKNMPGNLHNSIEKYKTLAREALTTGDRILAESYYQQAEHYLRINNESREDILPLPKTKVSSVTLDNTFPDNDFELSIEQELEIAQANL